MSRRAGIERELASRVEQRVLRWFRHVERMNVQRMEDGYGVDRGLVAWMVLKVALDSTSDG